MKKIREINKRLKEIKTEISNIIDLGESEKRELTDAEKDKIDELKEEEEDLEEEREDLQEEEKEKEKKSENTDKENEDKERKRSKAETLDMEKMKSIRLKPESEKTSLARMIIKSFRNQQFNDYENELIKRGQNELIQNGIGSIGNIVIPSKRAIYEAGTVNQGKEDVATELMDIVTPVWARQVLKEAGASFMTGCVGNIQYPLLSKQNADWVTETGAVIDGAGEFRAVTLAPKRLGAYVDVSKQMLIQDNSGNLETIINNEIVKAVSDKLESTLLGNGAAAPTRPAGLFNLFAPGVLTPTWAEVVALEGTLESTDVQGNKKVIMKPSIKQALKSTPKDAGSGLFLMNDDNSLNGYSTLCTSNAFGLIMGDFSRYIVANWGGTDITIDPYSQAINGVVRIVINTFWDAAALYDVSLATKGQPAPFVTANI